MSNGMKCELDKYVIIVKPTINTYTPAKKIILTNSRMLKIYLAFSFSLYVPTEKYIIATPKIIDGIVCSNKFGMERKMLLMGFEKMLTESIPLTPSWKFTPPNILLIIT
jgi:hypothetical protein